MDAIRELGAARAAVLDAIREEDRARTDLREAVASTVRTGPSGSAPPGIIRERCGGGYRILRNKRINRVA